MTAGPAVSRSTMIVNQRGLHARAAAQFAKTAERFDAEITVSHGGQSVSAFSIMGLLTLAAAKGTEIKISGTGQDAEDAVAALVLLVENHFEEEDFPGY